MPKAQPSHLAENIVHFGRVLRRAGLPVGPQDILDAVTAVSIAGLERRESVYWALNATLIRHRENQQIFDQAFHLFWRNPKILGRMTSVMLPEVDMPPANSDDAPVQRRLAEAVMDDANKNHNTENPDIDFDARETFSATEILRQKDFEQMSATEIAQARTALKDFKLPAKDMITRRHIPTPTGILIDQRRSFRQTLRTPNTITLAHKTPRLRAPSFVVLLDISGSMSVYARMFLHFLHIVIQEWSRTHVFLFGTRLTNITHHLRHRDVDASLMEISAAVKDWDGGTRIGTALHRFNVDWARRVLGQGAVVLLVTDGLERDSGTQLEAEIQRLKRLSRRLIWLNPLLRYDQFEPKASGMRAMLPHVDEFRPVHNMESLSALMEALASPALRRSHYRRPHV